MLNKRITGFTLAEVLIVLVVIGVVSTLTVPALVTNIQNQQYKTAYKKAYSDIDQATKRIMQDNAGTLVGVFSGASPLSFVNKYKQYMNYVNTCIWARGNCWSETFYRLNGLEETSVRTMDTNGVTNSAGDASGMTLNNGMLLLFQTATSATADCSWQDDPLEICGSVYVDVNGFNAPNTIGRDIFHITITKNGIKPTGYHAVHDRVRLCANPGEADADNASNWGYGCAARYLPE